MLVKIQAVYKQKLHNCSNYFVQLYTEQYEQKSGLTFDSMTCLLYCKSATHSIINAGFCTFSAFILYHSSYLK